MNGTTEAPNPRSRPRPTLSCFECRRKKLKCDRVQPCEQCVRSGRAAQCTYAAEANPNRAVHNANGYGEGSAPPRKRARLDEGLQDGGISNSPLVLKAIEDLRSRVAELERLAGKQPSSEPDIRLTPASAPEIQAGTSSTSNWTHGISGAENLNVKGSRTRFQGSFRSRIVNQFPKSHQFLMRTMASDSEAMHVVREGQALQKTVFRSLFATRYQDLNDVDRSPQSIMLETLPPKDVCNALLDRYMLQWEKMYRILHIPSFRHDYEGFMCSRDSQQPMRDSSFPALLTAILALTEDYTVSRALSDNIERNGTHISPADRCHLLHAWLSELPRKKRLELRTIQIQILLLLAEQARFVQPDLLWQQAGTALRSAMTIGLHCDPTYSQQLNAVQKEVRKRLWYTLVELDLQLSVANGMPPLIPWDEYNCCLTVSPPLNVSDETLSVDTCNLPESWPADTETRAKAQSLLSKSLPSRLQIAKYAMSGHQRSDLTRSYVQQLENIAAEVRDLVTSSEEEDYWLLLQPWLYKLSAYLPPSPEEPATEGVHRRQVLAFISTPVLAKIASGDSGSMGPLWLTAFKTDVAQSIMYLSKAIQGRVPEANLLLQAVDTAIQAFIVSIPVGGDLKEVLCLATAVETVRQVEIDERSMRARLTSIVDDVCQRLHQRCREYNLKFESKHKAGDMNRIESPKDHSSASSLDLDLFGLLEFPDLDLDLDWFEPTLLQ